MKRVLLFTGLFLYCGGVYSASDTQAQTLAGKAETVDRIFAQRVKTLKQSIQPRNIELLVEFAFLTGNLTLFNGLQETALIDLNSEFTLCGADKKTLLASTVEAVDNIRKKSSGSAQEELFLDLCRLFLSKQPVVSSATSTIAQQHRDLAWILYAWQQPRHQSVQLTASEFEAQRLDKVAKTQTLASTAIVDPNGAAEVDKAYAKQAQTLKESISPKSIEPLVKLAFLTSNLYLFDGLQKANLLDVNAEFDVSFSGKKTLLASVLDEINFMRKTSSGSLQECYFIEVYKYILPLQQAVPAQTLAIVQKHEDLQNILDLVEAERKSESAHFLSYSPCQPAGASAKARSDLLPKH